MKELKERTVLITGASYGVGPLIARAFASKGANVALAARTAEKLKSVATEIAAMNVNVLDVPTDLTRFADCQALVAQTEAELGPVDVLVNNASVHYIGPLVGLSCEQIQQIVETNLMSAMFLTRMVLPGMLQRKKGHVVHNVSLAGKVGMPYLAAYSASKHGLIGFNNALQAELRGTGVHSTAMCFGFISKTGMWARFNRPIHPAFGTSTPERVAKSVVRAIERHWVEPVINPIPVKPILGLWAVAPRIASWLFKSLRVEKFMADNAKAVQADPGILNRTI